MRGSLSDDPVSGQPVFGGIMLDVTSRKQAEDRVKAAEQRLRTAIEGFAGPFALWDARKRLLYWNRAFASDFGLQDTLRAGLSHETMQIARAGAVLIERQSTEDSRTTLIALRTGRWRFSACACRSPRAMSSSRSCATVTACVSRRSPGPRASRKEAKYLICTCMGSIHQ
jgi:PAS domain-containing protein